MDEIKKEETPAKLPEISVEVKEIPKETPTEAPKEVKEEVKIEPAPTKETEKNLLEFGEYRMFGPDNGDINIDRIEVKSVTGAHRIWKIKSLDRKQIVLDVIKFG